MILGTLCLWVREGARESAAPSSPFCFEPKTAGSNQVFTKNRQTKSHPAEEAGDLWSDSRQPLWDAEQRNHVAMRAL